MAKLLKEAKAKSFDTHYYIKMFEEENGKFMTYANNSNFNWGWVRVFNKKEEAEEPISDIFDQISQAETEDDFSDTDDLENEEIDIFDEEIESDEDEIEISDEKLFFRMVKAVFAQRRKTAANSISAGMSLPKEIVYRAIESAGYGENVRAESFTLDELAALSNEIYNITRQ